MIARGLISTYYHSNASPQKTPSHKRPNADTCHHSTSKPHNCEQEHPNKHEYEASNRTLNLSMPPDRSTPPRILLAREQKRPVRDENEQLPDRFWAINERSACWATGSMTPGKTVSVWIVRRTVPIIWMRAACNETLFAKSSVYRHGFETFVQSLRQGSPTHKSVLVLLKIG